MPVKRWSFNLIRMAVEKSIAMESDLDSDKISIKNTLDDFIPRVFFILNHN